MIRIYTRRHINILMPKMQGDPKPTDPEISEYDQVERYHLTFPKELVKSKQLKIGDVMGFLIVGDGIIAQSGDILIRKFR